MVRNAGQDSSAAMAANTIAKTEPMLPDDDVLVLLARSALSCPSSSAIRARRRSGSSDVEAGSADAAPDARFIPRR